MIVLTGCWPAMTEPITPENEPVALLNLGKWRSGANKVSELERPSAAAAPPPLTPHKHVVFKDAPKKSWIFSKLIIEWTNVEQCFN